MSGLLLPKKSFGDDCQPKSTSLTRLELSVDRSVLDPVVRYEFWCAHAGKPGNVGLGAVQRVRAVLVRAAGSTCRSGDAACDRLTSMRVVGELRVDATFDEVVERRRVRGSCRCR